MMDKVGIHNHTYLFSTLPLGCPLLKLMCSSGTYSSGILVGVTYTASLKPIDGKIQWEKTTS